MFCCEQYGLCFEIAIETNNSSMADTLSLFMSLIFVFCLFFSFKLQLKRTGLWRQKRSSWQLSRLVDVSPAGGGWYMMGIGQQGYIPDPQDRSIKQYPILKQDRSIPLIRCWWMMSFAVPQVISEKLLNLRNDLMQLGDDQPWKQGE